MEQKIQMLMKQYPILNDIVLKKPLFWLNQDYKQVQFPVKGIGKEITVEAQARLQRFGPFLTEVFTELKHLQGEIKSPITNLVNMKEKLHNLYDIKIEGKLLLKRDDLLPVAGSIKARGGFHEVLAIAESLALEHGLLKGLTDNYLQLLTKEAKALFKQFNICVGSTGNLGLSIGMIGSALGFTVTVHMSYDAKQWKKDMLRYNGVDVVEHDSDYSVAVEKARVESEKDPKSYFIDDENSLKLFAGYSLAATELQKQLDEKGIIVDENHPLFVYLPCGVGGGPGGVTFGLKSVFGQNVECYFAEPIHSPCMLIGLITKLHHQISVQDFHLDNITEADGLAVGRPSKFVGELMEDLLSGIYTVSDEELFHLEYVLHESEGIFLEPSALAGMMGPVRMVKDLKRDHPQATHLIWATGGRLVTSDVRDALLKKGKALTFGK